MNPLHAAPVWLQLLIVTLGVARLTVLVIADRIARAPRWWSMARLPTNGYLRYALSCPWCMAFEVGLLVSVAWLLWPIGTTTAMLPWAVAMVAGWSADKAVDPDPGPEEELALPPHP